MLILMERMNNFTIRRIHLWMRKVLLRTFVILFPFLLEILYGKILFCLELILKNSKKTTEILLIFKFQETIDIKLITMVDSDG